MAQSRQPPRVLITRAQQDAEPLAHVVRDAGGEPVCVPAVQTKPTALGAPLSQVIGPLHGYAGIAFASRHGVRLLHEAMQHEAQTLPSRAVLFAVGPATSDQVAHLFGRTPICAAPHTAAGLAQAVCAALAPGDAVLLPTAVDAGGPLADAVMACGLRPVRLPLYATEALAPMHTNSRTTMTSAPAVDYIVFTSPSCVRAFARWGWSAEGARVLSIGPSTTRAAAACGLQVYREATVSSFAGLSALLKDVLCTISP